MMCRQGSSAAERYGRSGAWRNGEGVNKMGVHGYDGRFGADGGIERVVVGKRQEQSVRHVE